MSTQGLVTAALSTCANGIQWIFKMHAKIQLTIAGMVQWQNPLPIKSYHGDLIYCRQTHYEDECCFYFLPIQFS